VPCGLVVGASEGCGARTSLSGFTRPGCLLAYSSKMNWSSMMIGMLITMVSSATSIVNIGSDGGGAREQDKSELLQLQRVAPDCTFDGAEVQDACNKQINTGNKPLKYNISSTQICDLSVSATVWKNLIVPGLY
jgi:hypothetical protein